MGKRTRNTDALLLPSREFVGSATSAVCQPKPNEPFLGGILRSLKGLARQEQRNHDILHGVKVSNEVKGLEYKANGCASAGQPFIRLHARPGTIGNSDLSVLRCIKACNEVKQSGLPAARLTGKSSLITSFQREVEPIKQKWLTLVAMPEVPDFKQEIAGQNG
jgi:hypothetical protein